MIDTDKYEGHTPAPWNVSRGQRNTVLIESEALGCSDCGSADIYTYENTNGEEIQFPHSVEPAPFTLSPDKYHGKWEMYCPSCDMLDYAVPIDATQNDADFELMADAPLLLEAYKRLRGELDEREAYIKRLHEQLVRATKWAYKQVLHNDSAMMDFDDYVWGEEE